MTVFLQGDAMIAIHEMQLAEHGGRAGLRDRRALEAIEATAEGCADLAAAAAVYGAGTVMARPFEGGNLATGAALMESFLAINGQELKTTDTELVLTCLSLAEGGMDEKDLTDWIRERL